MREGDQLRILVENRLTDAPTSIHWHGILVPAGWTVCRDISRTRRSRPHRCMSTNIPSCQSGTYWYHSHYGFQEQLGCSGAFIIEPAHDPLRTDRDAVILLGDWLHRSPTDVYAQLRQSSGSGAGATATPATGMKMDGATMDGGKKPA